MSELDDCFKISDTPITVDTATARFLSSLSGMSQTEQIHIKNASGRILVGQLTAPHNIPPTNNSAVDGYLVYFDDLNQGKETRLRIGGRIAAGHPLKRPAKRDEALQIFTGASIPEGKNDQGPDTVFMIEDVQILNDQVILPSGIRQYSNLRKIGEDIEVGDKILSPGHRLRPQDISMAAALGYSELEVFRRLRVAVFSSGDEIQDVGMPLIAGRIYDANRYSLISMLKKMGCAITDVGILKDDPSEIRAALWEATEDHDLIITSGGVSKGEEDHIRGIVENLGALNFWNLAIKPGRPIALGHIQREKSQVPFIGLPGNPVAVMVTFLRIARPLILRLSGSRDLVPQFFQVKSGFNFKKKSGRREWLRAHLERDENGDVTALKYAVDGSGIISSMVESDGLVELPEACEIVKRGDLIDFLPFSEVI